jgi:hypothetical protein
MKTFDEFLTEAKISTGRRVLRSVGRKIKKLGKITSNSKQGKKLKKYVGYTAAGAALKLLI